MEVPPEKKQKTDEAAANDAEMTEEKKAPEPPKENEVDAKPLKGKPVEGVDFLVPDTTVNIMSSTAGNLLRTLQDNGLQYLLAGARASVGIKSGRYMFEVQIVESPTVPDGPYPRNSLKIGVSIAGSSLLLDSEESSVSFDSDVYFAGNKKGGKALPSLRVGDVVACLINLDKGSPNHNTLSLFKNGTRVAEPKALPKKLHGTPLFPSVAFKSTTLHMNFGPDPICPLPFTCHMVGSALQSHAEVTTYDVPDSGEVLFPVSLPDEGSFDWLDMYLEKNPGCIEISDRAIREWVEKSAAWPWRKVTMSSKDKPEMGFGIPQIDNGSAKKALITFCTLQRRKYVVMEVKGNLVKEDRALALEPFKSANFKTSAVVLVGTPPNEFKKRSQALLLKEKQAASDKEHNDKFENTMKKWLFDKKQKELEKARKKAAKDREKAAKARAKAIEEAKKQAAVATEGKENEEKKAQDEQKEEEPEEEEPEEEEPMEPEPVKEDPPKVALTPEEKKLSFKPPVIPDLTQYVLNTTFAKFSLPEKVDGFDTLQYEFLKDGGKCQEYVQEWISSRKLTTRVEDIKPSARFHAVNKNWDKSLQDWLGALAQYKSNVAKKLADKAAKEAKKKMAAAKAAAKAAAAKATDEAEKKNGEEKKEEKEEEKKKKERVEREEDTRPKREERKPDRRSRQMFGGLLGHLHAAKSRLEKEKSDQTTQLRQKANEKLEEKIQMSKVNIKEFRKAEFEKQMAEQQEKVKELEKQIEDKDQLLLQKRLENHYGLMMNFIRTRAEPTIFYLPATHNDATKAQLDETRKAIKHKISSLKGQLERPDEEQLAAEARERAARSSAAEAAMAAAVGSPAKDGDEPDDDGKGEDEDAKSKKRKKEEAEEPKDSKKEDSKDEAKEDSEEDAKEADGAADKDEEESSAKKRKAGGDGEKDDSGSDAAKSDPE